MKSIKYFSWEKIFQKKISERRKGEFFWVAINRTIMGLSSLFWDSINVVLIFIFLVGFVNKGHSI
jgi:hypothetical protein